MSRENERREPSIVTRNGAGAQVRRALLIYFLFRRLPTHIEEIRMRGNQSTVALAVGAAALAAALPLLAAGERIDYDAISRIKEQGMQPQSSQVMEISSWLTDVYGPRLTGSPNTLKAAEWAAGRMKEWGLRNVSLEKWAAQQGFDRGWANEKFYMAAVSPQAFAIPGTPVGWTPGTAGLVRGEAVLVTETAPEDFQKYTGKLKG
jgi:hypothetical protein